MRLLSKLGALVVLAAALTGSASAQCSSCSGGGSGGTWSSGLAFIGEPSGNEGSIAAEPNAASSVITARALYEDQKDDPKRVMAYVGVPGDASYIEGSIHLPLDQVFNGDDTLIVARRDCGNFRCGRDH